MSRARVKCECSNCRYWRRVDLAYKVVPLTGFALILFVIYVWSFG